MRYLIKTFYIIAIICLLLSGCKQNAVEQEPPASETLTKGDSTMISFDNDTLYVNSKAAVFIIPDSMQIERRKKSVGEESFYAGADDYLYYLHLAHEFLDSMKLPTITSENKRAIKFTTGSKSYQIIQTDDLPELWNIYFFNPNKTAKLIDMTNIEEEYKSYFQ